MSLNMFNALDGFTESIQQIQAIKLKKQQEISHKMTGNGEYYGGFILTKDKLFKEALPHYEWDCVGEWHDKARVIIPLPPPSFGGIILYRLNEDKFCAKVLIGFSFEATFNSWNKLKNFCISRGLFLPPIGSDKNINGNTDKFAHRLNDMDEVMLSDLGVDFWFSDEDVEENLVADSMSEVKTDVDNSASVNLAEI